MTAPGYDVFISYRRSGGSAEARLIQAALKARHVRAFLDVTELGRGYFDEALLRHIEQTPNFLVILSPSSLDRSESDEDWLRKEIAHALATERNVVPLFLPGFQFPAKLPKDIRNLPRHQGMDYSHLYFDAMLQKLIATLDLSGGDDGGARRERPSDAQLEKARQERTLLEEERKKLEEVRAMAARERREGAQRWSDRLRLGDVLAGVATRQWALVAFWTALVAALASFGEIVRGGDARGALNGGAIVLALALWVRVMPRQAATPGLVIMALAAITQAGVAVTNNFNIGALTYAALAGMSTWAFWKLGRARTDDSGQSAEVSTGAFGARLADLLGVASRGPQVARLRWFFAARLAAGAFLGVLMQASQPYNQAFRVNVPFVVWVAATAPLALYYAFKALRQPLLSLLVAAVVTAALNPSVWFAGLGLVVLAQEVVGILLFAWATMEIASARLAMWFGAVSASLAGMCIVHWLAPRFWPMSTTDYAAAVLVAAAFWSVFALGTLRKTGAASAP